jgi:hypothetical protein
MSFNEAKFRLDMLNQKNLNVQEVQTVLEQMISDVELSVPDCVVLCTMTTANGPRAWDYAIVSMYRRSSGVFIISNVSVHDDPTVAWRTFLRRAV